MGRAWTLPACIQSVGEDAVGRFRQWADGRIAIVMDSSHCLNWTNGPAKLAGKSFDSHHDWSTRFLVAPESEEVGQSPQFYGALL
ncbi:hypothetical protein GGTG_07445 [Gaeumannomyces tritici R3-111a-1]|uniref:Uncharacterized protein n=1 Tax=Gaeumannomyces tritici (strain R3-111a-1) TaxID=644352 RepID=J3P1P7_GAET3|nr:hypothetical protein GGTG_07445 [Gaeumannomyces tritici R3-111a-1]EJT73589.1 hypothetical protein GGTG_07445 [Gaeumannomyces tritici R3-111a-1]